MNGVRDNLKWLAVLVCLLLAAGAGFTLWQQSRDNASLQLQLTASNTQRDRLTSQLKTAETTISTQSGQIITLADLHRQQAADVTAQLQRLDTITRNATARAVKLEAITHEDEAARTWGDTRLPAAVARLFDTTQAGGDSAGPSDRDADLRTGGGLPDPGQRATDQPPTGAELAEHTGSP